MTPAGGIALGPAQLKVLGCVLAMPVEGSKYIYICIHVYIYVYIYLTLCEKWLAISFQCDVTEFRKFQTDLFSYISLYCSSPISSEVAGNTSRRLL